MKKKKTKPRPRVIAVDFDGVLHRYSKGWDNGAIYDWPTAGAREFMIELREAGCEIIIFSTRAMNREMAPGIPTTGQKTQVEQWLMYHGIPFDSVWDKPWKPPADVFIDDRAIEYRPTSTNPCAEASEWAMVKRRLMERGIL
jgi:hypothetical protein